jgi:hypothetical protein
MTQALTEMQNEHRKRLHAVGIDLPTTNPEFARTMNIPNLLWRVATIAAIWATTEICLTIAAVHLAHAFPTTTEALGMTICVMSMAGMLGMPSFAATCYALEWTRERRAMLLLAQYTAYEMPGYPATDQIFESIRSLRERKTFRTAYGEYRATYEKAVRAHIVAAATRILSPRRRYE